MTIKTISFSEEPGPKFGGKDFSKVLDEAEEIVLKRINKWRLNNKKAKIISIDIEREYCGEVDGDNGVYARVIFEEGK